MWNIICIILVQFLKSHENEREGTDFQMAARWL